MALTVEQMLYGVWCHSTRRTDIRYAASDAGLVTVQKPTVTRTQLGESGTDWPRQQTFKRWDIGWWSSKDSVWYKIRFCFYDCSSVVVTYWWQMPYMWSGSADHRQLIAICGEKRNLAQTGNQNLENFAVKTVALVPTNVQISTTSSNYLIHLHTWSGSFFS